MPFPIRPFDDKLVLVIPNICGYLTRKSVPLKKDCDWICCSIFYKLIPVVIELFQLMDYLILIREAEEVVGNTEQHNVIYNL